jgi:hypothetical protein
LPLLAPERSGMVPLRVVVSDAGPLISLGRLDLLTLLPELFASVQVPEQVLRECAARPSNEDAARIAAAIQNGWLLACGPEPEVPPISRTLFSHRVWLQRQQHPCMGESRRQP